MLLIYEGDFHRKFVLEEFTQAFRKWIKLICTSNAGALFRTAIISSITLELELERLSAARNTGVWTACRAL